MTFFFLNTGQTPWSPSENSYYEFIEIHFEDRQHITSIATQGFGHEFVTEYTLLYSDDGVVWRTFYSGDGSSKVRDYSTRSKCESFNLRMGPFASSMLLLFVEARAHYHVWATY